MLRLDSLVDMVVPGKDGVDSVFYEERLDPRAQVGIRAVILSVRVQSVMEKADLPGRVPALELLLDPSQLLRFHVSAVEREEPYVLFFECVIALSGHVKGRVKSLVRIVVITDRRIEFHARVEQRLVGQLKLLFIIARSIAPIN